MAKSDQGGGGYEDVCGDKRVFGLKRGAGGTQIAEGEDLKKLPCRLRRGAANQACCDDRGRLRLAVQRQAILSLFCGVFLNLEKMHWILQCSVDRTECGRVAPRADECALPRQKAIHVVSLFCVAEMSALSTLPADPNMPLSRCTVCSPLPSHLARIREHMDRMPTSLRIYPPSFSTFRDKTYYTYAKTKKNKKNIYV
ncbi:uncharacterized protein BDR25DRAFT_350122 [Lindgomyces ingoldianus]|uniref:Uncharacterized protein n=1 Tax=Lindgomyces ingoldianus TaxID=673940 RepID=A0ACB6R9L1_9PLEO|nr:uncharacterized protein BDR25DRAFT_350122 [Lindgomyces ingoldianus]KAF2475841.1 hypothetical protein BDR25DRAFT_350122 [Lindgomyces ingoldianus]